MTDKPLVSILIPCHNAERYVGQCIDSALAQTYPNTEIIIVDDGSTDGSRQVIETYGTRVRAEFNPNAGANVARNRMLALARGTWVQYLDSDDYLLPDKIEKHVTFAMQFDRVDVVYSPVSVLFESGDVMHVGIAQIQDHIANYLRWSPFATHSMMLKRDAIRAVGAWKEDQPCCQEHELVLRLLLADRTFRCLNEPVGAIYRYHGNATISKKNPERVTRIRMDLTDKLVATVDEWGELFPLRAESAGQARFESARSMYPYNREYAKHLMRQAMQMFERHGKPLAPLRYRLAMGILGFEGAEWLASLTRGASEIL